MQDVLERFFRSFEQLLPDSRLRLLGRSATPSLGTRKPDVVGYLQRQGITASSYDPFHIVCLGEAKSRRVQGAEGVFTDQEKGHTLSFAEELVRRQPWRAKQQAGGEDSFASSRSSRTASTSCSSSACLQ